MKSIRFCILIGITMVLIAACSYIPHQWSEQQIREIVRDEVNHK